MPSRRAYLTGSARPFLQTRSFYERRGHDEAKINHSGPWGHGLWRGTGTLKVDGKAVDMYPMPKSIPVILPWCETFCVGIDTGTPVNDKDYKVPFRFTGKIDKVTIKLGPLQMEAPKK